MGLISYYRFPLCTLDPECSISPVHTSSTLLTQWIPGQSIAPFFDHTRADRTLPRAGVTRVFRLVLGDRELHRLLAIGVHGVVDASVLRNVDPSICAAHPSGIAIVMLAVFGAIFRVVIGTKEALEYLR